MFEVAFADQDSPLSVAATEKIIHLAFGVPELGAPTGGKQGEGNESCNRPAPPGK